MPTQTLPPTVTAPSRLDVDPADQCAAPECGLQLDQHPAGSRAFHVDGRPVGSYECGKRLHDAIEAAKPTVKIKQCCGVFAHERCDCIQFAKEARTAQRIRVGGAR